MTHSFGDSAIVSAPSAHSSWIGRMTDDGGNGNIVGGGQTTAKKRIRASNAAATSKVTAAQPSKQIRDHSHSHKRIKVPTPLHVRPPICVSGIQVAAQSKLIQSNGSAVIISSFSSSFTEALHCPESLLSPPPVQASAALAPPPALAVQVAPFYPQPPSILSEQSFDGTIVSSLREAVEAIDPALFPSMFRRERSYAAHSAYLQHHPTLDTSMRPILVDWMMEVCAEFVLSRETLQLAVNYVDRFLTLNAPTPITAEETDESVVYDSPLSDLSTTDSAILSPGTVQFVASFPSCHSTHMTTPITRSNLQLLGVTCLLLAAKLDEIYPPSTSDFASTTDGAYTAHAIDQMERVVLCGLDWRLHAQTPFTWCKMFLRRAAIALHATQQQQGADGPVSQRTRTQSHFVLQQCALLSMNSFTRTMEIIDLTLLDARFLQWPPSALAAAALFITHKEYTPLLTSATTYTPRILIELISLLEPLMQTPSRGLTLTKRPYFVENKPMNEEVYARQQHWSEGLTWMQQHIAEIQRI